MWFASLSTMSVFHLITKNLQTIPVKTMNTISLFNMVEYCTHVQLSKHTVKCTPHIIMIYIENVCFLFAGKSLKAQKHSKPWKTRKL